MPNRGLVFMFPGQGSQEVGMAVALSQVRREAAAVLSAADEVLAYPLSRLMREGPPEELAQTRITQPALLTASVAVLRVMEAEGVKPDLVAGHSVGEYAALVAAGSLDFDVALGLVAERGRLMGEASPAGSGGMVAVLGLGAVPLAELCAQAFPDGAVQVANHNSPGQVVLAGMREALEQATDLARQAGAKRVIPLKVSGPFHSRWMEPAAKGLARLLDAAPIRDPLVPVVANVSAEVVSTGEAVRAALKEQLVSPVRWEESLYRLRELGGGVFLEVGPGQVLAGLARKTLKEVVIASVGEPTSLEAALAMLKGAL